MNKSYDLENRTTEFAETIINLCLKIKITNINESIIKQIIRSAGRIGANYYEANAASFKQDLKIISSLRKTTGN